MRAVRLADAAVPDLLPPTLTRRQTGLLIASLMLGVALAALDTTIVGTAMPTIVAQLGGVSLYSWVVAAYLLTSTTTVPLYGRLADLYGRKPIFMFGAAAFLVGSALCGFASSMEQLIAFRAVQGLGAGAVMPMAMTIIGDAFGVERRARMQGFFSAVWGVSSVIGPALGGAIVTYASWGWIFFVNVPVGIAAMAMLSANYQERVERQQRSIDWLGALLLTGGVTALLMALQEGGSASDAGGAPGQATALLVVALAVLGAFVWVERRAAEPLIPLDLLRNPVLGVGYAAAFLAGATQFGVSSFVPLYVQGAMGGTALSVGAVLFPMTIGWPVGSIAAGRLLMRVGYRTLLVGGSVAVAVGNLSLLLMRTDMPPPLISLMVAAIGLGMGLTSSPVIIAIQNAVSWNQRGIATSLNQFARTIGGSFGIALMGALLNLELARRLEGVALGRSSAAPGRAGALVSQILDPAARIGLAPEAIGQVQAAMAATLREVYLVPIVCALAALVLVVTKFPRGSVQELGARPAPGPRAGH